MSGGRYSKQITAPAQVTARFTKLYAVICTANDGGAYAIYDSAAGFVGNPLASLIPTAGTELLFKGMTLKNGLLFAGTPDKTTVLTVIYE